MASGQERNLSPKQQATVAALLRCATIDEAAAEAGAPVRTLRHWRASDPAFPGALRAEQRHALAHAAARLTGLTARAITTFSMSLGGMWPARSTCGGLATALVNSTVTFKAGGEFPSAPVAYPFWRLQNDGVWIVTS